MKFQCISGLLLPVGCFFGVLSSSAAPPPGSGTRATSAKQGSAPTNTPATPPAIKPGAVAVPPTPLTPADAINAALDDSDVEGDYIPCKFSLGQLRGLILPDIAPTLSSAASERLKERIIAAALAQNTTPLNQNTPLAQFVQKINNTNFTNRTPGQALSLLVQALNNFQIQTPQAKIVETVKNAFVSEAPASQQPAMRTFLQPFEPSGPTELDVAKDLAGEIKTSKDATEDKIKLADDLVKINTQNAQFTAATGDILTAARKSVATVERPTDVGCSMSILDWTESSHSFGHLIANEYIPIQVVIRNLNRDQQFILHDIEFEVNADPTGRFGRFFSGRDKVIVRALSDAQTNTSPRAITVNTAQGVEDLLSVIAPFTLPGPGVTEAASAMNKLVTGLKSSWKDQSTLQSQLLSDVAFSSTANSQSVVPKASTSMYVIFIPARPFEEGWWTQPCVETHYLGSTDSNGQIDNLQRQDLDSIKDKNHHSATGLPSGVDVARALEYCVNQPLTQRAYRPWYALGLYKAADPGLLSFPAIDLDKPILRSCEDAEKPGISNSPNPRHPNQLFCRTGPEPGVDLFRNAYRVPYHHWSPNSQAIFRELANTVVSGMHITEDTTNDASITDICNGAKDSAGNLKIPDTGDLTCPVTGKNLAKFEKLQLRNSRNQLDTVIAEGPLTLTSGETSGGTVVFKSADLKALQSSDYDVFGVTKGTAVQYKTGVMVHLSTTPAVQNVAPALDFSTIPPPSDFALSGSHLSAAKSIVFTDAAGKTLAADVSAPTDTVLKFSLAVTDVTKSGVATGSVTVKLLDANKAEIKLDSTKSFPITAPPAVTVKAK